MIFVRLMGGLGNQMFQYAAARRLSLDRETMVVLDHSFLADRLPGRTIREYQLDCFALDVQHVHAPPEANRLAGKLLPRFKRRSPPIQRRPSVYRESGRDFDPNVLDAGDNTLLVGYWQSEKYFKQRATEIRQEFRFVRALSPGKQSIAEQIQRTPASVALHVRRGDYVSNAEVAAFHGLLSLDYYERAIEYLTSLVERPEFFVISDDHVWCHENLALPFPTTIVETGTGQEDMNLMSQCQHQIIANSSFGWWAAWLNTNPDKIVVSPMSWVRAQSMDTADRIPPGWVRL